MSLSRIYFWSNAPFARFLFPFTAGILLQWKYHLSVPWLLSFFSLSLLAVLLYFLLPLSKKYSNRSVNGFFIHLLLAATGALLVWKNDTRNNAAGIEKNYRANDALVVALSEPLTEKANSYKALAGVRSLIKEGRSHPVEGNIILYFAKDPSVGKLSYGARIVFDKPLQEIKNSGNPGGFDYKRYCLFQGVTRQVYLAPQDYKMLPGTERSWLDVFLFRSRLTIVSILQKYIPGTREQGLAEALLIGYKNDLDKDLVQAYSNTGVVHIIAISGLHLGLIYGLLVLLTRPLAGRKRFSWPRFLLIVAGLWLFSLLAGAQPSVLRSSVMFSCLAFAEVLGRRTSIVNTLALSAFILLCYNPFWLWDVGFQLSYAAVLSIIIFYRPVYNWLFLTNKAVDWLWKINAVTISAQILTIPVSLYHFHQFPVLFLFTNFVAVPLSGIILMGEILLCVLFFIEPAARWIGMLLQWLIGAMNRYVERLDSVGFAVWNGFSLSIWQTVLLTGLVAGVAWWLMEKKRAAAWLSLACLFSFVAFRSYSFAGAYRQQELIVYNTPHYQAIDLIEGRRYRFIGDTALLYNDYLKKFHLQPSRIIHRLDLSAPSVFPSRAFSFSGKRILIIDSALHFSPLPEKLPVDVLILSKSPKLDLAEISNVFSIKQVVIDASVPARKAKFWKEDCTLLHLPCYDVSEKGAFVLTVR